MTDKIKKGYLGNGSKNHHTTMKGIRKFGTSEYTYNGMKAVIKSLPYMMQITINGHTANTPNLFTLTDVQGIMVCLDRFKKDLKFDKYGNII